MTIVSREKIFHNKWVSLMESLDENGCRYIYTTEPWSGSKGVAVLVHRWQKKNGWGYAEREFLGRYEICPAHSDEAELCSITGGLDKPDEDAFQIAIREVKEEAGYDIYEHELLYLGSVRPSKASDKEVFLFAVDVTGKEQGEAIGDGTLGEVGAYTKWVARNRVVFCKDPLMGTMVTRLDLLAHFSQ